MDLNNYITTNPKNPSFNGLTAGKFERGVYIDQIQFKIVHGIDVNDQAIPKWFKDLRFMYLVDYCLNEHLVTKDNIFYHFSSRLHPENLMLSKLVFKSLSLKQLVQLSELLPAGDILEYIKFKPSEPYILNNDASKVNYDLVCYVAWDSTLKNS